MYAPPNNVTEQCQWRTDDRDYRNTYAQQDDQKFDGVFHLTLNQKAVARLKIRSGIRTRSHADHRRITGCLIQSSAPLLLRDG